MNKRIFSVLAFAIAVSAIASFLLYRLISAKLLSSATPATVRMMVAARKLEVGTLLKESDVKVTESAGKLPPGALSNLKDIEGRGVISDIFEGEPILDGRLAPIGAGAGLAATIPPGMRAVAVRVNEVVGVAGFVSPGQHVDILIAGNPPGGVNASLGTQTKTLLQNISVLSAGQNIQKDPEGKPVTVQVVNLLVTPEQAEILSLASNETRIQLILRNPLDKETTKTPGTAIANLFSGNVGLARQPAAAVPTAPRPVVQRKVVPAPPPVVVPEPPRPAPPITIEVYTGKTKADVKFAVKEDKP
jgi:pilus assembly protein CpaB